MGKMGQGYGSEFHLLQWMADRRSDLNSKILEELGRSQASIEWLQCTPKSEGRAKEWKGLDFLSPDPDLKKKWDMFWPTGKGIHNWDAVGVIDREMGREWLLVEAKAHVDEILTDCKATDPLSVKKIQSAFTDVKDDLGVAINKDWIHLCYQFTNRLALLWFLHRNNIQAHLLFIYFTGDKRPKRDNPAWNPVCPSNANQWKEPLEKEADLVGLPQAHPLRERIHKLFLPALRGLNSE